MEKIKLTKAINIKVLHSDDYLNEFKSINSDINCITKQYNSVYMKDYVDNLNSDIFLQDKKILITILYIQNMPVSVAIFSKISNTCAKLDLICTSYDFIKLGFATINLRVAATQLLKNKITKFVCDIIEDNSILLNLMESFAKVEGVDLDQSKEMRKFDISKIDIEKVLQDLKGFAV